MRHSYQFVCAAALMGLLSVASAEGGALRSWTSSTGNTVKAELIKVDGDRVILRGESGQEFIIAMSGLSTKDQVYVTKFQKANAPVATVVRESDRHLACFAVGENKGMHAVYTGDSFDAVVNRIGGLRIYPKDKHGERILDPALAVTIKSGVWTEEEHHSFKVVTVDNTADPVVQPGVVQISGTITNDNPFEQIFEFERHEITVWQRAESPRQLKGRFHCNSQVRLGPIRRVRDLTTIEAIKKAVAGYKVSVEYADPKKGERPVKGRTGRAAYTFDDPMNLRGSVEELVIDGVYGSRTVTITAPKSEKAAWTSLYNYRGMPLYEGFCASLVKEDPSSDRQKYEKMTIRIE